MVERTEKKYDRHLSDGNASSTKSTLVRFFFFLSIAGNFVTMYRSFTFGIAANTESSFNEEEASFLPPQRNSQRSIAEIESNKRKRKRKTTKSAYRTHAVPFKVTHFLSHIPKTGVEYAAQELGRFVFATMPLPGNKSIFSIEAAQKRYNQTLQNHPDYNQTDPEWLFFNKNSRDHDHGNPDSDAYSPYIVCNHGKIRFRFMGPFFFGAKRNIKFRCNLAISEEIWTKDATNVYTIVRDPVSHVVSQYYHCVDSIGHRNTHLMPPLNEWLDEYTELADTIPLEHRAPYIETWRDNSAAKLLRKKFDCYNPIDSESTFVKFPVVVKDELGEPMVLPKDYRYPYPPGNEPPRDEKTRKLDQQLFDDLKNRFRVIGDTARMIKTICSIFIDMTDGKYIPSPCDCTHWDETKKQQHSSTPTFEVPNLYQTDTTRKQISPRWTVRPYLELGYDPQKHAHGVKTRGSDFVKNNLTDFQKTQITDHLRTLDVVLYNISRAVFDAQTSELEKTHGIKICDDSFNREGEVIRYKPEEAKRTTKNKRVQIVLDEKKVQL